MTFPMTQFLLDMREAAAVWLALVGLAVLTILCMLAPGRVRSRRDRALRRTHAAAALPAGPPGRAVAVAGPPGRPGRRPSRNQLAAQAGDLVRYAREVAVAAQRAGLTAQRRRDEWLAAQQAEEEAWEAFTAADKAAARMVRAAAFPLPATTRTPAEYAQRERYLHQAASAAYRRGELAAEQLADALTHRNGWDPRRHPFEQDAALARAARQRMLRRYQEVSAAEHDAWRAAQTAELSRRSLEAEAVAAMVRARHAYAVAGVGATPRRLRIGAARRPTLAIR